jgi:hypothetical protein
MKGMRSITAPSAATIIVTSRPATLGVAVAATDGKSNRKESPMRKKLFVILAVLVFAVSLGLSFSVTAERAQADDGCRILCIDFCLCQMSMWSGKWVNGYCNLNLCGPPCDGEGVPCL